MQAQTSQIPGIRGGKGAFLEGHFIEVWWFNGGGCSDFVVMSCVINKKQPGELKRGTTQREVTHSSSPPSAGLQKVGDRKSLSTVYILGPHGEGVVGAHLPASKS